VGGGRAVRALLHPSDRAAGAGAGDDATPARPAYEKDNDPGAPKAGSPVRAVSAPVDREQLRRTLGDALSAIQRDGDVTGLDGLAASLTTLEGAYAFHGQATAKGPGRDASELPRADLEPSAGACEAGEENLMSSDRANLKDRFAWRCC
jgi:hypothetical protein